MKFFRLASAASRLVGLAICFAALTSNGHAGEVSFPSLDDKLQLSAYWLPSPVTDKRPVVISLHGCEGMYDELGRVSGSYVREAAYFNAEQIHLLALDSFRPRDINRICETPDRDRTVNEKDRRADVFAAIRWLASQPNVDSTKIAILGRSHGGQTVLMAMDHTDKFVQAQPIQPRAGVALYPGCTDYLRMWDYEISAPLLVMSGELDDWTPAKACADLQNRVVRGQKGADFQFHAFPDSYHAFDSTGPVHTMYNIGNRSNGMATVGGNPEARIGAHKMTFEFLSAQFNQPLLLSHEQRLRLTAHRYIVPPDTDYARINDVDAVPVTPAGKPRFNYYLSLPSPKAFVVTEKGGWYFGSESVNAISIAFDGCVKAKVKCWLYAVDDHVVWSKDAAARVSMDQIKSR